MNELFDYLKEDLKKYLNFDKIYISFIKEFKQDESIVIVFKNETTEIASNSCKISYADFTIYFRFKDEYKILDIYSKIKKYIRTNINLKKISIGFINANNLNFLGIDTEQFFNYSSDLKCVYAD